MPIDNSHIYKALVERLSEKCSQLQQWNEQYVHRINKIKKNLRYQKRDVALLKARLDKHRDNWRTVPMIAQNPKRKIEQKRGPKPKPKPELTKNQQTLSHEEAQTEVITPALQQTEPTLENVKQGFRFQVP